MFTLAAASRAPTGDLFFRLVSRSINIACRRLFSCYRDTCRKDAQRSGQSRSQRHTKMTTLTPRKAAAGLRSARSVTQNLGLRIGPWRGRGPPEAQNRFHPAGLRRDRGPPKAAPGIHCHHHLARNSDRPQHSLSANMASMAPPPPTSFILQAEAVPNMSIYTHSTPPHPP